MIFIKNNSYRLIAIFFVYLLLVSCARGHRADANNFMGLYQVAARDCNGLERYKADCNKIMFVELVKGQFFGVKDDEIALVFWSGDIGEELLYQARKIDIDVNDGGLRDKIIISETELEHEYLFTKRNDIVGYGLTLYSPATGAEKPSAVYNFTLQPANRSALPSYRMNYPGNQ